MTSLALVPYTFSLLKLPLLALQNVADYLNPFEIYHFSRISKKTKSLAKVFSKKATHIYLISPFCVIIDYRGRGDWSFEPNIKPGPDSYTVCSDTYEPTRSRQGYGFFSKKPASEVLRVLERAIDLFKNPTVYLQFTTGFSSHQDLLSFFNWFMESPSEVPYVSMGCTSAEDVQFFIKNYKKPTQQLNLVLKFENNKHWFLNREQLELPDDLETKVFKHVEIQSYRPVSLDLYNIFSSPNIDSIEHQLTYEDLNTFIKNWQSGLTNPNWRSVSISGGKPTNLIPILEGITATCRDPRTVKRQITVDNESCWIFGGIDIEKHDGSAIATIQWKKHRVKNEDSEVPNQLIEEYERNQETGEIQHMPVGPYGNMEDLLVFSTFCMYIW